MGMMNKFMPPRLSPSIVDIEASGFGPDSYPIEIGVVKGNGERYCALIKPDEGWTHWSQHAENVHGISRSTIVARGRSVREVCQQLNEFLMNQEVYSDAWAHDERWLAKLFRMANMTPSFHLKAIEFIMGEQQFAVWDNVKQQVSDKLKLERHRASSDAFLIQQTYVQTMRAFSAG